MQRTAVNDIPLVNMMDPHHQLQEKLPDRVLNHQSVATLLQPFREIAERGGYALHC